MAKQMVYVFRIYNGDAGEANGGVTHSGPVDRDS